MFNIYERMGMCQQRIWFQKTLFHAWKFIATTLVEVWQKKKLYDYQHEIAKYFLIFKHSPVKEFARSAFLHVL